LKKQVILAIVMAFVLSITCTAFGAASQTFTDVPAKHWAYAAVDELARVGIIDGYGDGTFRGDKTMTRYEMSQIVEKAMANSDKATAVQKALIDKLAIEFALELNKIDKRVTTLEKSQPNLKWSGNYQTQFKIKESRDTTGALGGYSKGQYKLQLNGVAKVDDTTMLGFRFADPAPTSDRFRDSTTADYGDVNDNGVKLDRVFVTTKVGQVSTTLGRQAMTADAEDLIIDSSFFSFDGIKVAWKMGAVNVDAKRGRFARKVNDVYAFNGHPKEDFKNVDVNTLNLAGKSADLSWNAGWVALSNDYDNKGQLADYYFGGLSYLFAKNFSMGTEVAKNYKAVTGGKIWMVKGVYGAQSLNDKGKQNFTMQYTKTQANGINPVYTGLDQVTEGQSHAWTVFDLSYRYAFSKSWVGRLQRAYLRDQDDAKESYDFWKVQMAYRF